jgi:WD40 repeat protein
MEKEYIVHDCHPKPITSLGCNIARREIYMGFEDGIIKTIDIESGKLQQTYNVHKGWITCFLYWPKCKYFFAGSNDSVVSVINSGGNLIDRIFVSNPVYALVLNSTRRKEVNFFYKFDYH